MLGNENDYSVCAGSLWRLGWEEVYAESLRRLGWEEIFSVTQPNCYYWAFVELTLSLPKVALLYVCNSILLGEELNEA